MNVFKNKLTVLEHPAADVDSASSNDWNQNRRIIQFFFLGVSLHIWMKSVIEFPLISGTARPVRDIPFPILSHL